MKNLFLTHHDPAHDDDFLDQVQAKARELAASLGSALQVSCAREGFHATFENDPADRAKVNEVNPGLVEHRDSLLVLVVDDDEDLRVLVRKSLTRAGHRVIEADNGIEGLELIGNQTPDLVVLDLNMPDVDGFEVLRRIRANEANRALPVIVLTAQGDEESAKQSFERGATDFLPKPFTPPQLDARVRSCFTHAQRKS